MREAQKLSLDELARLVGTTNQQISHLENGRRRLTVDWLQRLGAALGAHPWALVSPEGEDEAISPQEAGLLRAYRCLSAEQRAGLLALVAPSSSPAKARAKG
ncbi:MULTISPECIES: helix-turn-helix domain-containing protein [Lysobacter]|uniref:helix-turn-helix domain-containing protein n=1 Tax=Lysobacter TaxID=68 RepID=UPI001F17D6A5|nr:MULTISPECIES: helix-turn-helix transcriptional regulator [Lysobacter]UJB19212.1 helix-turn-helix domain-containing protein [Lysobacter capsici]UJQ27063.1 helix-turn-helix domain-containing protein [Lysobacter gummosus]